MFLNGIIVFAVVVIVNVLAQSFKPVENDLLNLLLWAFVVSLAVGVTTKNYVFSRR